MEEITASRHAIKRIRQRLGLNKKAAVSEAKRARHGVPRKSCSGSLRRYLDSLYKRGIYEHEVWFSDNKDVEYRVTPAGIFVYGGGGTMITVLNIPDDLKKTALNHWMKKGDRRK